MIDCHCLLDCLSIAVQVGVGMTDGSARVTGTKAATKFVASTRNGRSINRSWPLQVLPVPPLHTRAFDDCVSSVQCALHAGLVPMAKVCLAGTHDLPLEPQADPHSSELVFVFIGMLDWTPSCGVQSIVWALAAIQVMSLVCTA